MPSLVLKRTRERSLLRRHPWVFSGAVDRVEGDPPAGSTVEIRAADGRWLGRGGYSPASQIVARIWTFREGEAVDGTFFRERIARAAALREALGLPARTDALRLVHGESDGLPGIVVDRYGDVLVLQLLWAGADTWRETLVEALRASADPEGAVGPVRTIHERSEGEGRRKEHLQDRSGPLHGEPVPERIRIREDDRVYLVDVHRGHKTGFYLDQRENRRILASVAAGAEVLNCFAYTGSFTVAALRGGARHVVNVESSADALGLGRENLEANGLDPAAVEDVAGDVFEVLRSFRDRGRSFDVVVLDPPKFAESRSQVERAARGYKDINLLALKLLRPGGLLLTFSCSGHMDAPLFQKVVADAALDAGREARILRRLEQAPDHPTALTFPEGSYLKGLLVRVA